MEKSRYPEQVSVVPQESVYRFRLKYAITEDSPCSFVIRAMDEPKKPNWYDPLTISNVGFNTKIKWKTSKSKKFDESINWLCYEPHIALRRLHITKGSDEAVSSDKFEESKFSEIEVFVNNWGLLGLWNVEEYRKLGKYQNDGPRIVGTSREKYSRFYHTFQEPVFLFEMATKEYQETISLLENDNEMERDEGIRILGKYISACWPDVGYDDDAKKWVRYWNTPSLLHACYLRTWIDLTNSRKYRYCANQNCKKPYVVNTNHPNDSYCSSQCRINAKQRRYDAKRKLRIDS
jgi:hypothetical protein